MYVVRTNKSTSINLNQSVEGETIEQKIERIVQNKEPITDGAPLIYTDRKDGVEAGYNIKTDRFEIAVEAMDKVTKSNLAKRDNQPSMQVVKDNAEGESTQGTGTDK